MTLGISLAVLWDWIPIRPLRSKSPRRPEQID